MVIRVQVVFTFVQRGIKAEVWRGRVEGAKDGARRCCLIVHPSWKENISFLLFNCLKELDGKESDTVMAAWRSRTRRTGRKKWDRLALSGRGWGKIGLLKYVNSDTVQTVGGYYVIYLSESKWNVCFLSVRPKAQIVWITMHNVGAMQKETLQNWEHMNAQIFLRQRVGSIAIFVLACQQ